MHGAAGIRPGTDGAFVLSSDCGRVLPPWLNANPHAEPRCMMRICFRADRGALQRGESCALLARAARRSAAVMDARVCRGCGGLSGVICGLSGLCPESLAPPLSWLSQSIEEPVGRSYRISANLESLWAWSLFAFHQIAQTLHFFVLTRLRMRTAAQFSWDMLVKGTSHHERERHPGRERRDAKP